MTAAWIAYAVVVGVLVTAAAHGIETIVRSAGLPVRWVWTAAIALLFVLVALAPARSAGSSRTGPRLPSAGFVIEEIAAPHRTPAADTPRPKVAPRVGLGRWTAGSFAAVARFSPRQVDRALTLGWLGSTLIALGLIGGTHYRLRRRRRRWPISILHGERVRVSDDFGPAVIGIRRGEIVVPRWLMQLPAEDSHLVVAHEAEHVRTRDPLLLFLNWTVAALLAWNPAAWWILSRLRLAVEIDCDARLLRRGADTQSYALLLIRLVDRYPGPKLATLALAGRRSHLERRLLAMTSPRIRHRAPITAAIAALASAAILAACAAKLPTSDELRQPEVTRVEVDAALPTKGDAETVYTLDGTEVTRKVGNAVDPAVIPAIAVTRGSEGPPASAENTSPGDSAPPVGALQGIPMAMPEPAVAAVSRTPASRFRAPPPPGSGPRTVFAPGYGSRTIVYLVDGVRTDVRDGASVVPGHPLYGIAGSDIIGRAVLMCGQATRIVPKAVDGLVVIRTRNGPDDGIVLPPSRHLRGAGSGTIRPRSCGESLSPASVDAALNRAGILIVDGFRATHEQALAIPASAIYSISLPQRSVTPAQLMEHYGPDAADGVAVVTTKAGDWRPAGGIAP